MHKVLLWFRIRLVIVFVLLFQLIAIHSAFSQNNYSIQHFTNKNGLPAYGVKGFEIDEKTGFVWIGTQAGLVRFDGKNFLSFGSEPNIAPGSRTILLTKDNAGVIYAEDDNFSLFRIEHYRPKFIGRDSLFPLPYYPATEKHLSNLVNKLIEISRTHKNALLLPFQVIFHGDEKYPQSFSFLFAGHGYYYDNDRKLLKEFPGINGMVKVDNSAFFARSGTLWKYNDSLDQLLPIKIKGVSGGCQGRFIWKTGIEDPLFICGKDIWKLVKNGNTLELSPVCKNCCPANAEISSVQIWEKQGLILLGSEITGLYIARAPYVLSVKNKPSSMVEYAQAEIEPGIVITASGLSFSTSGKLLPQRAAVRFDHSNIYRDAKGDFWFSSQDTIIHYYTQQHKYVKTAIGDKTFKFVFGETNNRIYAISEVAIAEVTGDRYQLLYNLPSTDGTKKLLTPESVVEWRPGILAIAADKPLLFDVTQSKEPETISIPDLTAKVRALLKYGNYLFIGTYGQGIYIYKDGVAKKIPQDKNGYLAFPHCFIPDDNGFCWITTNRGLFKASMKALIVAYENNLDEIYYHYFGENDGIFNTEFNGGCQPCALKLSNGLYSFPSMNGMVLLNPEKKHSPPPNSEIFIEEVLVDSATYRPGDRALTNIPYDTRNIRFKIALPQFGNTENIYFSYKLEPYSNHWEVQDITQNNLLQFGGLKSGDYQLKLRVRSGFEADQFIVTTIIFHIDTPWYQTFGFYCACIAALIILVWALIKWRTARILRRKNELQQLVTVQTEQLESQLGQLQLQQTKLEEDNKIKSRLISIVSHDMINPLQFMSYMSEKVLENTPPSEGNYQTIQSIVSVAKDIESLSVNLLNWIRFHYESFEMAPVRFILSVLVNESVVIASKLAKQKNIEFIIDIPETLEVVQYPEAVGVILYNLSMNAVKHTDRGQITISSLQTEGSFTISITDTGKGIPAEIVKKLNNPDSFGLNYSTTEAKKYQFGYVIIKDLLRLSKGTMTVESTINEGTTVKIQFKIMRNYTDSI